MRHSLFVLDGAVLSQVLPFFTDLPPSAIYLSLGIGAALENIFPPVPADTFVVLGGFLAAQGRASLIGVFLATWGGNVASALAVYGAWSRYGPEFFDRGLGRHLLKPRQIEHLGVFYDRWGAWAIFLSRFLPGFRAVVPVFAGVTHQRLLTVAIPLTAASAIWYGFLTWLGGLAGRNLETILGWLANVNRLLLIPAILLAAGVGLWWYLSRRESGEG